MQWLKLEKHKIDFLALATRKEKNPWIAKFYLVFGLGFFAYLFYHILFAA
ncbi:MAG: hypothetical protein VYA17_02950 [Pseudomonadota bacterium]|nr:hypothetical protein [Pseudomonadota bacterium]